MRTVTKTWVKRHPALGLEAAIYIYVASYSRYEWTEAEISQVSQLGAFVELLTPASTIFTSGKFEVTLL